MHRLTALLLLPLLLLAGCAGPASAAPPAGPLPEPITVVFLNAGKADCTLLLSGGSAFLIDAGTNKTGKQLASLLQKLQITSLEGLLITHFDKDHVGGADKILASVPVKAVYEPDYPAEGKQTEQYRAALQAAGLVPTVISQNTTIPFAGTTLQVDVINAATRPEAQENDYSLALFLAAGEHSFFFTGDAERPRLAEWLGDGAGECTVLKMPHHGVVEKNTGAFLDRAAPSYAVITCSDDEPEEQETLSLLYTRQVQTYLTRNGTVVFHTDGHILTVCQLEDVENVWSLSALQEEIK